MRILSREKAYVVRWAFVVVAAHLLGAVVAISFWFVWYWYVGVLVPFVLLGLKFGWYGIKGHMVPPAYGYREAIRVAADEDTQDARSLRKMYSSWVIIAGHMMASGLGMIVLGAVTSFRDMAY